VPNGEEAIVKARNESFDVFLIDIILPDMEGTEVLTQIQSINPNAINIMITGYPSIDNTSKSTNMGANSHQIKPLKIDIFIARLKRETKKSALRICFGILTSSSSRDMLARLKSPCISILVWTDIMGSLFCFLGG